MQHSFLVRQAVTLLDCGCLQLQAFDNIKNLTKFCKSKMFTSLAGGVKIADTQELTKQDIRIKIWNYLQENKIARFPLPVHNRIPNFEGGGECGQKVAELPLFISSHTVKVNPDKPQEEVRFLTLQARKKLLVPSPRLKNGLFNLLENEGNDDARTLRKKAQSEGVKFLSKPIDLHDKIIVNLIVIGSVAVSTTGRRIGKGEGFADLEYAMMKTMKAIDDSVPIITTVHDSQVFDELPSRLFQDYDVPVDVIVTPNQVINVSHKLERPKGIYWRLLSAEKFLQLPVLRTLYEIDKENNVDVTLLNACFPPRQEKINSYQENRMSSRGTRGFSNRGRGTGRSWRGSRGGAFQRHLEDNEASGEEFTGRVGMGRGRGRGRGNVQRTDEEAHEWEIQDPKNIQVTINISKQNKIVRRSVEETDQPDRVGFTNHMNEVETPATFPGKQLKKKKLLPIFSVFIGGIPRGCRPHELKAELANHDVRPSYVAWKGANGFAFLNFYDDAAQVDQIMELLQGLSLRNKLLKVNLATRKEGESEKDESSPQASSIREDPTITTKNAAIQPNTSEEKKEERHPPPERNLGIDQPTEEKRNTAIQRNMSEEKKEERHPLPEENLEIDQPTEEKRNTAIQRNTSEEKKEERHPLPEENLGIDQPTEEKRNTAIQRNTSEEKKKERHPLPEENLEIDQPAQEKHTGERSPRIVDSKDYHYNVNLGTRSKLRKPRTKRKEREPLEQSAQKESNDDGWG